MDNFFTLELLGFGAFGKVYKGRRKGTAEIVALKFIAKRGRSRKDLDLLYAEINVMRSLKHPNIIRMIDTFETPDQVVVVTEFAEGELFQIIEDDKALPLEQVRSVAQQLVAALRYLHSNRIMHRDMKPQNILIGKGGVVKLCDFGFARAMSINTLVLTSIKGTPLYMAPELVREQPYDHTADLWSLGCILYEITVGKPPFYTNNIFQLVKRIVKNSVNWPPNIDPDLKNFVEGLLVKNPRERLAWPAAAEHPFITGKNQITTESRSPLTQQQPIPPSKPQSPQQLHEQKSIRQQTYTPPVRHSSPNPKTLPKEVKSLEASVDSLVSSHKLPTVKSSSTIVITENNPNYLPKFNEDSTDMVTIGDLSPTKSVDVTSESMRGSMERTGEATPLPSPKRMPSNGAKGDGAEVLQLSQLSATSVVDDIGSYAIATADDAIDPDKACIAARGDVGLMKSIENTLVQASNTQSVVQSSIGDLAQCLKLCCNLHFRAHPHGFTNAFLDGPKFLDCVGKLITRMTNNTVQNPENVADITHLGLCSQYAALIKVAVDDRENTAAYQVAQTIFPLVPHLLESVDDGIVIATLETFEAIFQRIYITKQGYELAFSDLVSVKMIAAAIGRLCSEKFVEEEQEISMISELATRAVAAMIHFSYNILPVLPIDRTAGTSEKPFPPSVTEARFMVASLVGVHSRNYPESMTTLIRNLKNRDCCPFALQIILHCVRHCTETAIAVGSSEEWMSQLCTVIFEQDTDVLTMGLLTICACLDKLADSAIRPYLDKISFSKLVQLVTEASVPNAAAAALLLSRLVPTQYFQSQWDTHTLKYVIDGLPSLFGDDALDEGDEFGFRQGFGYDSNAVGLLDGPLLLILELIESKQEATRILKESRLPTITIEFLEYIENRNSSDTLPQKRVYLISPRGCDAAMLLAHKCISEVGGPAEDWSIRVIHVLPHFLASSHVRELEHWLPVAPGSPPIAASNTILASVRLLLGLLAYPWKKSQAAIIYKAIHKARLLHRLFHLCYLVLHPHRNHMQAVVGLVMRLAMASTELTHQFVEASESLGSNRVSLFQTILTHSQPIQSSEQVMIIDTTAVIAHLARTSPEFYPTLNRMEILDFAARLLASPESEVRARACNTLGNMFRHSAYFYESFSRDRRIDLLTDCVTDADAGVQKFACFALGNLLYYNDSNYQQASRVIKHLVDIVRSTKSNADQLKANAVGALGNFARNSNVLDLELALNQAPSVVMQYLLSSPPASGTTIALFALGTFAKHRRCRSTMQREGVQSDLEQLRGKVSDKYLERILRYMNKP